MIAPIGLVYSHRLFDWNCGFLYGVNLKRGSKLISKLIVDSFFLFTEMASHPHVTSIHEEDDVNPVKFEI